MRWNAKTIPEVKKYALNDMQREMRFAWFPTRVDGNQRVWLEYYWEVYRLEWRDHRYYFIGEFTSDMGPGRKWILIKKQVWEDGDKEAVSP